MIDPQKQKAREELERMYSEYQKAQHAPKRLAYSIEECAALAPVGRTSIYKAINSGELVARKCGRRTFILAEDFAAFLQGLPITRLGDGND